MVAGGDAVDGGHDFAELAGTVTAGAKGALGLVPKLNVVSEKWILRVLCHVNPLLVD
jgi:hypothetical protein